MDYFFIYRRVYNPNESDRVQAGKIKCSMSIFSENEELGLEVFNLMAAWTCFGISRARHCLENRIQAGLDGRNQRRHGQ